MRPADFKAGAAQWKVAAVGRTMMRAGNSPDYRQPQATATVLGILAARPTLEGIEDHRRIVSRQARAAVLHAQAMLLRAARGADAQAAGRGVLQDILQQRQQLGRAAAPTVNAYARAALR